MRGLEFGDTLRIWFIGDGEWKNLIFYNVFSISKDEARN
jgi:hypothetical protein